MNIQAINNSFRRTTFGTKYSDITKRKNSSTSSNRDQVTRMIGQYEHVNDPVRPLVAAVAAAILTAFTVHSCDKEVMKPTNQQNLKSISELSPEELETYKHNAKFFMNFYSKLSYEEIQKVVKIQESSLQNDYNIAPVCNEDGHFIVFAAKPFDIKTKNTYEKLGTLMDKLGIEDSSILLKHNPDFQKIADRNYEILVQKAPRKANSNEVVIGGIAIKLEEAMKNHESIYLTTPDKQPPYLRGAILLPDGELRIPLSEVNIQ